MARAKTSIFRFGRLVLAALLTALGSSVLIGLCFSLIFALWPSSEGDLSGTLSDWLVMASIIGLAAFVVGFPLIVLIGVPITQPFVDRIRHRKPLAYIVGTASGGTIGAIVGGFIGSYLGGNERPEFLFYCSAFGAVFGLIWIKLVIELVLQEDMLVA